jgi:Biotin-lipoyl like
MKKILLEIVAVFVTLIVASVIILVLFTQNVGQMAFDTFSGNVNKIPIDISSPVYGQIMTLPVREGDTVHKGQTLATIHILRVDTAPADNSPLYQREGMMIRVQSPSDGVVGQIAFAPLSTVASANSLMQLYTATSMEVQILLPQGSDMHNYTAFYASHPPDTQRYALHGVGQVPTNVLSNIDPTTSVYRATCTQCQALLNDEAIAIYAQRKQAHSPFFDALLSWWNAIQHHL